MSSKSRNSDASRILMTKRSRQKLTFSSEIADRPAPTAALRRQPVIIVNRSGDCLEPEAELKLQRSLDLVDLPPVHPRLDHFDIFKAVRFDSTRVLVEDYEVSELAGLQASDLMVGE